MPNGGLVGDAANLDSSTLGAGAIDAGADFDPAGATDARNVTTACDGPCALNSVDGPDSDFSTPDSGLPAGAVADVDTNAVGEVDVISDVAAPDDVDIASGCDGPCATDFASGPDWESFSGTPSDALPSVNYAVGATLGAAQEVCLNASTPANCPAGAILYGYASTAWTAGSTIPQAHWIWRGDVSPTGLADLQVAIFEKTLVVGQGPSGSIAIGGDDFAEVFVNDVFVGAVGSVSDSAVASFAYRISITFDFTSMLRPGPNKITVVGQNGASSFSSNCGVGGCTYQSNPAGVVFAGTIHWQ